MPSPRAPSLAALAAALACAPAALSCAPDAAPPAPGRWRPPADESPVVARVGEVVITSAELERRLAEMAPLTRARYQSPERRRELLDSVVRFELLARRAREAGYGEDPDAQLAHKQAMVRALMDRELRGAPADEAVTDAQVEALYAERAAELSRPAQVRVAQLCVPDEAEARVAAAELKARLVASPAQPRVAWGAYLAARALARRPACAAAPPADLGYRARPAPGDADPLAPVVEAAWALAEVGAVSPPVASPLGWHIAQRVAARPAVDRPLDEVREQLRGELVSRARSARVARYVEALRAEARVEVNEEALRALKVELSAGAEGPPPRGADAGPLAPPPPAA
ncbi:MAG: hypothetical protein FJ138_09865, partial [Deltaproteobacteria bacterium]|nr:hypothetical protein [Deltaproteobacteria bacterium]